MISLLGLVAACSASPGEASRGSSRAASPEESSAAIRQEEDERRATESRRKMQKRPGFRDEVPLPRV